MTYDLFVLRSKHQSKKLLYLIHPKNRVFKFALKWHKEKKNADFSNKTAAFKLVVLTSDDGVDF